MLLVLVLLLIPTLYLENEIWIKTVKYCPIVIMNTRDFKLLPSIKIYIKISIAF